MPDLIYVMAEAEGKTFGEISFELTSEAARLAKKSKDSVHAIIIGGGEGLDPEELIRIGASRVLWLRPGDENHALPWDYLKALERLLKDKPPAISLAGMTPMTQDILAPLAVRIGASLLTSVHFIKIESGGRITVTRPFCEGKASVHETVPEGRPVIIACPVGLFNVQASSPASKGEIEVIPVSAGTGSGPRWVRTIPSNPETMDIAEAEMIVSGGAGARTQEDFEKILDLAHEMGAAVAGTREARLRGWIPQERQIGQTGKEVKPKIIICCGVSGAMAHLAGMKDAEKKVAINTDKNAPIFKYADMGVIGDLKAVVPELIRLLQRHRG